jgi:hypothetical protein
MFREILFLALCRPALVLGGSIRGARSQRFRVFLARRLLLYADNMALAGNVGWPPSRFTSRCGSSLHTITIGIAPLSFG